MSLNGRIYEAIEIKKNIKTQILDEKERFNKALQTKLDNDFKNL